MFEFTDQKSRLQICLTGQKDEVYDEILKVQLLLQA
jgi:hypothetical protein